MKTTYTLSEAATVLGYARSTVCKLGRKGDLARDQNNRYAKESVDALLELLQTTYTLTEVRSLTGLAEIRIAELTRQKKINRLATGRYSKQDVDALIKDLEERRRMG